MASPCSYLYGTSMGSAAGDVVLALPGHYDVTGNPVHVTHPLTIIGDPGKPRPVFENKDQAISWALDVDSGGAGTVLKHLEIQGFHGLYATGARRSVRPRRSPPRAAALGEGRQLSPTPR